MLLLMLSLGLLLYIVLIVLSAVRTVESKLSTFELNRREASGDPKAKADLRRDELLAVARSLHQPLIGILFVLLPLCLVAGLGWERGIVAALVAAILHKRIASIPIITKLARKFYAKHEPVLLESMSKHAGILRLVTGKPKARQRVTVLGSIEELKHAIETSQQILSADDKKLAMGALAFRQRRVSEIMSERADIVSVEHTELLGPLVLSDLHKSGHSCFPVINKDLDHVIGILDTRSQFALEAKRSLTAAKTMSPKVFTIQGDDTLDRALAAFVHTRHHLLIVVNETNETTGLLSLGDVLEALFGERIADVSAAE
jgi:Mg2+/Co2+ transporter CorB